MWNFSPLRRHHYLTASMENMLNIWITRDLSWMRGCLPVAVLIASNVGALGPCAAAVAAHEAVPGKAPPATMFRVYGDELPTRPPLATGDESTNETVKLFAKYTATHQELKLQELFAANAVWLTPSGAALHGADEIGKFLAKVVAVQQAQLAAAKATPESVEEIPFSILGSQHDYFIELAIKTPYDKTFMLTGASHLTLDDSGKIIQAISYVRPRAVLMMQSHGMLKESDKPR